MKRILFLTILLAIGVNLNAQFNNMRYDKSSIGIGAGFDYGGFGVNFAHYPVDYIGVFGGVGYALADLGYNAGVKFRYISSKNTTKSMLPFLMGMYGYNTAIKVNGSPNFNKLYYGPTVGAGLDFFSRSGRSYWTFAITFPIRGSEPNDYIDDLKDQGVKFENELFPVGLTVGWRFIMN